MRTFIALPPLAAMTGGLAVLLRMGETLFRAGFEVCFVAREHAPWLAETTGRTPVVPWPSDRPDPEWGPSRAPLCPEDIWLTPEGWPSLLLPGLRAPARTVVYVQNWAYLLGEWPEGLSPAVLPLHFLAVSRPVAWHVREMTGREAPVLRPGIDARLFVPACPQGLSIGWMPRKNKALARQIREMVNARRARRGLAAPVWTAIHNMTQPQVATALQSCDLFLATGFPEGCPLPPLEAMACGCVGVGFSGFGGWDYMRSPEGWSGTGEGGLPCWLPEAVRSAAESRPVNGLWTADGDVVGAALAVDAALSLRERGGAVWEGLRAGCRRTAELYDLEAQSARLRELWALAARSELF